MTRRSRISRRSMLAAGAGGLAALPFLRPIRAAAEGDVTKNIIFCPIK